VAHTAARAHYVVHLLLVHNLMGICQSRRAYFFDAAGGSRLRSDSFEEISAVQ
jgi:hypothetical protein